MKMTMAGLPVTGNVTYLNHEMGHPMVSPGSESVVPNIVYMYIYIYTSDIIDFAGLLIQTTKQSVQAPHLCEMWSLGS